MRHNVYVKSSVLAHFCNMSQNADIVFCTRFRFLSPRSRSQSGQKSKLCLINNPKTTEANLTKLHRKIEHNEKACSAQELGSYAQGQGQGHNQVRVQIVPKIVFARKLLNQI